MTTHRSAEGGHGVKHLIRDVQRFGLFSAATVVDRYTAMVDRAIVADRIASPPSSLDGLDPGSLVDRAARLGQAYLRLLDTTAVIASRVGRGEPRQEMETLVLPPAGPAGSSETSMWIHNPTSAASTGLEVAATGLISTNRATIPAEVVRISPRRLDRLDPSTSREIRLRIHVPSDQPAGLYFGVVLISEVPGDAVSLLLKVEEVEEDPS